MALDDVDLLEQATTYPAGPVERSVRVANDEVERSPGLLLSVNRTENKKRTPEQFILTGSVNLVLMKRVSESLARSARLATRAMNTATQ